MNSKISTHSCFKPGSKNVVLEKTIVFLADRVSWCEGYSVGCKVQPHCYVPLNPAHFYALKGQSKI